jgi:hypothetical protein
MGSLKRKMQRKKDLKKSKEAKKNLKRVLNATMGIPTSCSMCSADFDPIKDADTWIVTMVPGEEAVLICETCQSDRE